MLNSICKHQGLDEGTGVTFEGQDDQVRHLGILVGRDPRACAQQMFAQRIAILRDRVTTGRLDYWGPWAGCMWLSRFWQQACGIMLYL